jgi:hypothetical protein
MESVFYAKRGNDTIFFAELATKKTGLNKRHFIRGIRPGNYRTVMVR